MNHIIAALYVIGIAFAVWAGIDSRADPDVVATHIAAAEAAMDAATATEDPSLIAGHLTEMEEPLASLISADVRLPTAFEAKLEAFEERRAALVESISEGESGWEPSWTQTMAIWSEMTADRELSDTDLLVASLSTQGNTLFIEFTGAAELAVTICIGLIGIMALWLGLMRVAEEAGIIQMLARVIRPILRLLFPKVPKDHPAEGAVMMSMAANILGLDNAATPLGLKAMQELQTLNSTDDTLTDDQIMLLALNTSSVNLIPFTVIAYRVSEGSTIPSSIIIPTIIATSASTAVAIIMVKIMQRTSNDPALVGAEAEAVRDRLLADIHAAAHGEEPRKEDRR